MPRNPHPFRQASSFKGTAAPDGREASGGEGESSPPPPADFDRDQRSEVRDQKDGCNVTLPIVIDPFTKLGDEVAGESPDEIALNLGKCCELSRRYFRTLQHEPPNLRKLFRGIKLTEPAKNALRFADRIFETATG